MQAATGNQLARPALLKGNSGHPMSSGIAPLSAAAPATKRTSLTIRGQILATLGVCFVVLLAVLAYAVLIFGSVVGQEFAPDSFMRREFSFFEIPLIGLQITPVYRRDVTNSLESHLTTNKIVHDLKTPDEKKRWDLVAARRTIIPDTGPIMSQGDARILCEYLDAEDSDDERIWLTWTNQHPELAKVVWPAVARVARQELYIFAPELLLLARNATDPALLKSQIDVLLAEKYVASGSMQQQLGDHEAAVELFTEAISLAPSRADALVGRARSLTALGKTAEAEADLAQAERPGSGP